MQYLTISKQFIVAFRFLKNIICIRVLFNVYMTANQSTVNTFVAYNRTCAK